MFIVRVISQTLHLAENKGNQGGCMEELSYSTIGPIMKAARKYKKLNQAEVAQAIGCSQSALSKMEHNLLIPSAPQWFAFSRYTSIPLDALELGVIDRHSVVHMDNDDVTTGFKIPKGYRRFRAEKVSEFYPFLKTFEALGKEFINSTNIDPEFFLDFDNLINYQLFLDMVRFYISHQKSSIDDIQEIVEVGQDKIYLDRFGIEWSNLSSSREILIEYIKKQAFYQTDFILSAELSGDHLIIKYIPDNHVQNFVENVSDEVLEFIKHYRKYSLENLVKQTIGQEIIALDILENPVSPLEGRFEIRSQLS